MIIIFYKFFNFLSFQLLFFFIIFRINELIVYLKKFIFIERGS